MKVKDLVSKLKQLDGDLDVLCYSEDEAILAEGDIFRLLHIKAASVREAERLRNDRGLPTLKIGRSNLSEPVALIQVTTEF